MIWTWVLYLYRANQIQQLRGGVECRIQNLNQKGMENVTVMVADFLVDVFRKVPVSSRSWVTIGVLACIPPNDDPRSTPKTHLDVMAPRLRY